MLQAAEGVYLVHPVCLLWSETHEPAWCEVFLALFLIPKRLL